MEGNGNRLPLQNLETLAEAATVWNASPFIDTQRMEEQEGAEPAIVSPDSSQ